MKYILIVTISVILIIVFIFYLIYHNQEKLIFFPEVLPQDFSFQFRNRFEEVFLHTPDKERIHALFFRVNQPKGVILYFHGNAGSLRSWGGIAEDFTPLGYDLFIIDFRGYGKSTGSVSEKALLGDGEIYYEYLKERYSEEKIILFGRSIGTGIAVHLAEKFSPGKLILETPYTNLPDLAKYHYPMLPGFLIRYALSSDKWLLKVKCPVYIFHGTSDSIIPFEFGNSLSKVRPENTILIPVEGGDHNNLGMFPSYREGLLKILN
ncbi:MAG: alpha/beta hydrolase [Leptospira sp.]|nr:alpha/beta hydrolase [Leptospira sp.]